MKPLPDLGKTNMRNNIWKNEKNTRGSVIGASSPIEPTLKTQTTHTHHIKRISLDEHAGTSLPPPSAVNLCIFWSPSARLVLIPRFFRLLTTLPTAVSGHILCSMSFFRWPPSLFLGLATHISTPPCTTTHMPSRPLLHPPPHRACSSHLSTVSHGRFESFGERKRRTRATCSLPVDVFHCEGFEATPLAPSQEKSASATHPISSNQTSHPE